MGVNPNRVSYTETGPYRISTVRLPFDHSFGDGPALWYETMVFKGESWEDLFCQRYTTEEQALEGHKNAVETYKSKIGDN